MLNNSFVCSGEIVWKIRGFVHLQYDQEVRSFDLPYSGENKGRIYFKQKEKIVCRFCGDMSHTIVISVDFNLYRSKFRYICQTHLTTKKRRSLQKGRLIRSLRCSNYFGVVHSTLTSRNTSSPSLFSETKEQTAISTWVPFKYLIADSGNCRLSKLESTS